MGHYLQADGHRVRLATHANFRNFVMDEGLEFYPLGGDPKILAECEWSTQDGVYGGMGKHDLPPKKKNHKKIWGKRS